MRAAFLVTIFVSTLVFAQSSQLPQPAGGDYIDAATRERLVSDVLRQLEQKFVFPKRVTEKLPVLVARWSTAGFAGITSAGELINVMNADLTDAFHDGHLLLLPQRADAMPPGIFDTAEPDAAALAELEEREKILGYGIVETKVLDGNIGYIEIQHFPYVRMTGLPRAIVAAMERVRETKALIIDLRWNSGGDGDTVAHIMAYLLDRRTLLAREYDRVTGKTSEDWTPATVPGPRYGAHRPVWVLISRKTFSGGEEMAYDLQTLKRGRLIGETTGGGAHHNMVVRVGGDFVLSIPTARAESPITHTDWDGVGVKPDVAVDAQRALDVALAEARKLR